MSFLWRRASARCGLLFSARKHRPEGRCHKNPQTLRYSEDLAGTPSHVDPLDACSDNVAVGSALADALSDSRPNRTAAAKADPTGSHGHYEDYPRELKE